MYIGRTISEIFRPGSRSCAAKTFSVVLLIAAAAAPILVAAIRGPGKYNGVVFYDRWDNCYLLSGVYLMYISDTVKESLRPYRGKSLEIDAKQVYQPNNPGDGLIKKLEIIGESKDDPQPNNRTPSIRGVELRASVARVSGRFRAVVEIHNNSAATVPIESHALGFAVISHDKPFFICPSDGTSCAVITRVSATSAGGMNRIGSQSWRWAFDSSDRLPNRFTLRPGEARTTSVLLDLHNGAYQFIAGYGGGVHTGPSVASNAVSIDVVPQMRSVVLVINGIEVALPELLQQALNSLISEPGMCHQSRQPMFPVDRLHEYHIPCPCR
jgi:hypothetical protein